MKNAFALLFLSLFIVSCNNDFCVKGTILSDIINDEYVYIKKMEGGVYRTIDSCRVSHGAFEMCGPVDTAFIASFCIGNVPVFPFVAERGTIEFEITDNMITIGGTPLNEELNTLVREQAQLEARMTELERRETSLILNGCSAEAAADCVNDSIEIVGEAVEKLMNSYVRRNMNNVLGPCIFAMMYSAVPAPILNTELETLFNDAPDAFRNDSFVKAFYDVARENAARLKQQRLFD